MSALVIYDSKYGNTAKIAQAIGDSFGCQARPVSEVTPAELQELDLIIIGSPTHGGFPTDKIHGLLKKASTFKGVNVATFDTRTKITTFGYAAPKIGRNLRKSGANLLAKPEGFYVHGMEGPLLEGELERAADWASQLVLQTINR